MFKFGSRGSVVRRAATQYSDCPDGSTSCGVDQFLGAPHCLDLSLTFLDLAKLTFRYRICAYQFVRKL